jgi:hypothetical protein
MMVGDGYVETEGDEGELLTNGFVPYVGSGKDVVTSCYVAEQKLARRIAGKSSRA